MTTLSNELAALDAMATKPTDLTMPLRLTYLEGGLPPLPFGPLVA